MIFLFFCFAFVFADPQTTLHHQIRKVSVGDGGFPPLHATRGEHCSRVGGAPGGSRYLLVQESSRGGKVRAKAIPSISAMHGGIVGLDWWLMFAFIVFQLYDACKGKSSQVRLLPCFPTSEPN